MCGLYGFLNYSGQEIRNLSVLTNSLAEQAAVRGTDATGIAYNDKGKIVIQKDAKSAYQINLKHPDSTVCVTGHTRHATQGNKKRNYNNHPFGGLCKNLRFACVPSMVLNLTVKVRYGGTYQPTISEAQAIHREVEAEEVCSKIVAR